MSPDAFRSHLSRLGYSQAGFARFMDVAPKTVERWASGAFPVPRSVAMALKGEKVPPASPENAVR